MKNITKYITETGKEDKKFFRKISNVRHEGDDELPFEQTVFAKEKMSLNNLNTLFKKINGEPIDTVYKWVAYAYKEHYEYPESETWEQCNLDKNKKYTVEFGYKDAFCAAALYDDNKRCVAYVECYWRDTFKDKNKDYLVNFFNGIGLTAFADDIEDIRMWVR